MFLLQIPQQKMLGKLLTNISLCVLVLVGSWYWHQGQIEKAKEEVVTSISQQYQTKLSELKSESLLTEIQLKSKLEEVQNAKAKQKASDDARISALISSLQNRPNRPTSRTDIPANTDYSAAEEGTTGVRLYQGDGKFLVRFAGMAAELQRELNSCLKSYGKVKTTLEEYKAKHEF